jgi:hypothetical protein
MTGGGASWTNVLATVTVTSFELAMMCRSSRDIVHNSQSLTIVTKGPASWAARDGASRGPELRESVTQGTNPSKGQCDRS